MKLKGFEIRAGADLEASIGRMADRMDAIEQLLKRPNISPRFLPAAAAVAAGTASPVLLDFGAAPDGRVFDMDLVSIWFKDPWTLINGLTAVDASSANAAAANNVSLPAVLNQTNFVTGFEVTGAGATAGSVIAVTLTGVIGGPLTYELTIPAGAGTSINPLIVEFPVALPATGPNVAITLNVPSFGAGNTNAAAVIHGYVTGGTAPGVSAALFVGEPPINTALFNPGDLVALGLAIPGSASYATRRPTVRNKQHFYALISGPGLAALAGNFYGVALASTIPDTPEAMTWL